MTNTHPLGETFYPTENKELFLENPVSVPPSLMLHSKDFPQLKELLPIIKQNGYKSLTYDGLYSALVEEKSLKNSILISLDDLSITYLEPELQEIISEIDKAGMVGTLAIVTRGTKNNIKPEIWQYFKSLQEKGWEMAVHTEDHVSLPLCSDAVLKYEIGESYKKILEATGKAPISLVLPYGIFATKSKTNKFDQRIFNVCRDLGIRWVIGIADGKEFSGKSPFYVGRIGPNKNAQETMNDLTSSFTS